ncbi:MAG: riboflavin synthase [Firmicutes bacterium]|jgi:riboflavin synthase|nr:riboflavin synthase [Bacillota bacterium]
MFTGIVEEIGLVENVKKGPASASVTINAPAVTAGTKTGDSIAVNGICLTVTSLAGSTFTADIMHESLNRSSLSDLRRGSRVNLERAMAADGRFGGHIVSGHVDGTGIISAIREDDNAVWYTVRTSPAIMRYIVEKGSVTIDGVSLTVAAVTEDSFSVSVIPHTRQVTIMGDLRAGDKVNLENDIIGKYVEKFLKPEETSVKSNITREFLTRCGF